MNADGHKFQNIQVGANVIVMLSLAELFYVGIRRYLGPGLLQAIAGARTVLSSTRLASIMNLRDKHLAHSLETTRREKNGPVQPMKCGDETKLLNVSVPILESLYCWVNGTSFSIENSQKIDQNNAEAVWTGCKFVDLR